MPLVPGMDSFSADIDLPNVRTMERAYSRVAGTFGGAEEDFMHPALLLKLRSLPLYISFP